VAPERGHRDRGEDAGHDGQQHAAASCRFQHPAQHHDGQHSAEGELQADRLMHQCQRRDDDAVRRAPRQRDRPGPREGQRHGEHRQRRGTEQIGSGRVGGERYPEGQQRNQHGNHEPALGSASREQHHAHDDREAGHVHRGRQPAQPECEREPVAGGQADQLACQAPTDEAERVVDCVIRHPVDVEWNDVDREAQHGRRPDRNGNGDTDVEHRARTLVGFQAQIHHELGPSR